MTARVVGSLQLHRAEDLERLESLLELLVIGDEVFDAERAAAFLGCSTSTLGRLNVPRAVLSDDESQRGLVKYLKSQLLLYVLMRTTPRLRIVRSDEP